MKKLILFGEPLSSPSTYADKHKHCTIALTHVFKAVVLEDGERSFGLAFHHGGLGGRMIFFTDNDISFAGEEVNKPATSWWINSLNNV